MEIKNLKLAELRLNPTNPREVVEEKYKQLIDSVLVFPKMLELRPVVHNARREVLGGNMRLRALQDIAQMSLEDIKARLECLEGYRSKPQAERVALLEFWQRWLDSPYAPAASAEGLTDAEQQEFIIKDNLSFGKWDWEALANGWDEEQLGEWGLGVWQPEDEEELPEAIEDDFSEEQDEIHIRCKKGDIWQLGEHRLMCGDTTDLETVKSLMGGVLADVIVTDPPYNVNYVSTRGMTIQNDNMSAEPFYYFLCDAFNALDNNLKPGGAFYIWHADSNGDIFRNACTAIGWKVRQCLIWKKNHLVLGRQDYQWMHEPCLYGWKEGAGHYFIDKRNQTTIIEDAGSLDVNKLKKDEMRDLLKKILNPQIPVTVIEENTPLKNDLHPTMKPVALIGRLIRNSSKEGDTVLDGFGGSGTTIIAAEQLGRKAYAMELDEHYCDVILARWEKMTGKQAIKIN